MGIVTRYITVAILSSATSLNFVLTTSEIHTVQNIHMCEQLVPCFVFVLTETNKAY